MSLLKVTDFNFPNGWNETVKADERAEWYCRKLEEGEVIFFENPPFDLPNDDREFLLSQRQADSRYHKNISYRPNNDVMRGASASAETDKMRLILQNYSKQVTQFLGKFLAPYAEKRLLDFASFRPLEEEGRDLPLHKRNDLLHVDAFPSRPTKGGRILRIFTNINPHTERVWNVGEPFETVAGNLAVDAGLNQIAANSNAPLQNLLRRAAGTMRGIGLPVADRSPYDKFMLRFHDYLKENNQFQTESVKTRLEFPPHSTWLVYTDGVPHAALSGQFALEQTYIIPLEGLVSESVAPIRILENLCGQKLA